MSIDATCTDKFCREEGTYWMLATCGNCAREFDVELTKGHAVEDSQPECTYCGAYNRWTWTPSKPLVDDKGYIRLEG